MVTKKVLVNTAQSIAHKVIPNFGLSLQIRRQARIVTTSRPTCPPKFRSLRAHVCDGV